MTFSVRTGFTPETTLSKRDKRNPTWAKTHKINEAGRYPVAHNGLVAGSSPAEPTKATAYSSLIWLERITVPDFCFAFDTFVHDDLQATFRD